MDGEEGTIKGGKIKNKTKEKRRRNIDELEKKK